MAKLEVQITVNLTAELRAFVAQSAERESRTVAGQIRHLVVEAYRRAGAPPVPTWDTGHVMPTVEPTTESITEARGRIDQMQQERARIERKRRGKDVSAAEDDRDLELRHLIRVEEQNI